MISTRPFGKGSAATVQAGRFTMNLGSRRLVASDDFRNTPQGYTGLRAEMKFEGGRSATLFMCCLSSTGRMTLPR
ncbi:MAG: alginate export family protein [Proteobacteria bacterium]|nr:alginate export family protein [Pseudomonadota bacterium]